MIDLKGLIGGRGKIELFVSFVIGKNWVQAGLWGVEEGKGTLLAQGSTSPWQQDAASFVGAADDSLSSAVGTLSPEFQEEKISRVVFGLPPAWVISGQVEQNKLELLKQLCKELELSPSGFVIIPEAICYMLRQKEGAGSFILVGLGEEEVEVTLVIGGKVIETKYVSRSLSPGDDVSEGLARFESQESLPPRVILYNRHPSELQEVRGQLTSWEWPQNYFLHTPRVEILPPESIITAVSEAAAMEVANVQEFQTLGGEEEKIRKEAEQKGEAEQVGKSETLEKREDLIQPEEKPKLEEAIPIKEELEPIHPPQYTQKQEQERKPIMFFSPLAKLAGILNIFGKRLKFILTIFAILVILGAFALWFFPQATVTVYIAPKTLEGEVDFEVSTSGETSGKLTGRILTEEVTGEKTGQASGRKVVGDRAKGEVTIYNNTAAFRTFAAGTILINPNNLKFLLDQEAKVASESGAPNYKPGEAKAKVTAADIGAEYNLSGGTLFNLANFSTSSFSARNDAPLSGGSSREVPAVDENDLDNLEKELTDELIEKASVSILTKAGSEVSVLKESAVVSTLSRNFSAKKGEEANTLGLKLSLRVNFILVSHKELSEYLINALTPKVPQDFTVKGEALSISLSQVKGEDGKFKAQVKAPLLPKLDTKELAKSLAGKGSEGAKAELIKIPGFTRITIKLYPKLPILNQLPRRAENIKVEVMAE